VPFLDRRQYAPVPTRRRLAISLALACVAGAVTIQSNVTLGWHRDFGQAWFAARAMLNGGDPYLLVGPGLAYDWPWPLIYPLTTAVAAMPFAVLAESVAVVLFSMLGGGAFAWALMEFGYAPLFGFVGGSLRFAAETAQWSPLLAASVVIAPLAFFLAAKPTIGLAMFIARPTWWAVAGGAVLGGIALAVQPHWIAEWLHSIALNNQAWAPLRPYRPPILYPGGIVALLCLTRWRRPEARLVAAMACVPHTAVLYETVPLFLVPRTFPEAALLVALSYTQHFLTMPQYMSQWAPAIENSGRGIALLMYIPATIMVLRRPNEGALPASIERAVAQLGEFAVRIRRRTSSRSM
jgi:hypothetical protein